MKGMRKILLVSLFVLFLCPAGAVRVSGTAAEYAGRSFVFFTHSDPVTRSPLPIFTLSIGHDGNFSGSVEVTSPVYCFADFGIFRGRFFLNPGRKSPCISRRCGKRVLRRAKIPILSRWRSG